MIADTFQKTNGESSSEERWLGVGQTFGRLVLTIKYWLDSLSELVEDCEVIRADEGQGDVLGRFSRDGSVRVVECRVDGVCGFKFQLGRICCAGG